MLLVVQQIQVDWGKDARGGIGAKWRNSVPEAHKLQNIPDSDYDFPVIRHVNSYGMSNKFQKPFIKTTVTDFNADNYFHFGCVTLARKDKQIVLQYMHNGDCGGAPMRFGYLHKKTLNIGGWERIVYNGRFGDYGNWRYHKVVFNIALLDEISPKIFMGKPSHTIRDMADLL